MTDKKFTHVLDQIKKVHGLLNIEHFVIADAENPTGKTKNLDISNLPSIFKNGGNVGVHSTSTSLDSLDKFVIIFVLFTLKRLIDLSPKQADEGEAKEGYDINIPSELDWNSLPNSADHLPLYNAYLILKIIYQNYFCKYHYTKIPKYLDIGWESLDLGHLNVEKQRSIIKIFSDLNLSASNFSGGEITDLGTTMIEEFLQDYKGKYWMPESLSKLLIDLFNPVNSLVYDPTCGLGSIVFSAKKFGVLPPSDYSRPPNARGFRNIHIPSSPIYIEGNECNPKILGLLQLRYCLEADSKYSIREDPFYTGSSIVRYGMFSNWSSLSKKFNRWIKAIEEEENGMMDVLMNMDPDFGSDGVSQYDPLVLCKPPFDEKPIFLRKPNGNYLTKISVPTNRFSEESSEITLCLPENSTGLSYILQGLFKLEARRMGIILSNSLLEGGAEERMIRKFLIDEDYIETIIKLPDHIFGKDSRPSSILILNKEKYKERRNKVLFMNSCVSQEDSATISKEEIERLVETHNRFATSLLDDHIANLDEVQNNDYILTPDIYINKSESEIKELSARGRMLPLKDLLYVVGAGGYTPICNPFESLLINKSDLSKEFGQKYITYENWGNIYPKYYYIDKPCVLLTNIDGFWASAIFDPWKTKKMEEDFELLIREKFNPKYEDRGFPLGISIEPLVFGLIPKENCMDLNYLYCQFNNPLIIKQLNQILKGRPISSLTVTELISIKIPVLGSIAEQVESANNQMARALEEEVGRHNLIRENLEQTQQKLKKVESEFRQKQLDTIDHLSHNISPKIMDLKSIGRNLKEFLRERGIAEDPLTEPMNKDQTAEKVGDSIDTLLNNLTQVNDLINRTGNILNENFKQDDFNLLDLKNVFEEIKSCFAMEEFKINVDLSKLNSKQKLIHKTAFNEAMNNLIRNAKEHGFKDPELKGEINFKLFSQGEGVVIDYTNNGIPMKREIGETEFLAPFVKGTQSSGSGLGGAWIAKLIKAQSGSFEIIKNSKHNVHFRISLRGANISEKE